MKAFDFFCGGGGMTYGLRLAGINVVAGVDFDIDAKETYEANNPGARFINADIGKLEASYFEKEMGIRKNDDQLVMVGCSPCQYYSLIRSSKEKSKKSKNLLLEFWKFIDYYNPGYVLVDTAFKRRWEFEYIGIDENAEKVANYEIPIGKQDDKARWKVKWDELRRAVNDKLISLGINEDKLLGPYFFSESVLESALDKGIDFVKSFESKVLMYLFEDAAKMKVRQLFRITSEKYIYSEVCKEFEEKGVEVFDLVKFPDVVDIASSES